MVALWFVCERGGMVDALSSGGSECILVRVQVPPFALFKNVDFSTFFFILWQRLQHNVQQLCICLKMCDRLNSERHKTSDVLKHSGFNFYGHGGLKWNVVQRRRRT